MAAPAAHADMNAHRRDVLMAVYEAFNERDTDGVLVHLAPDVDWPNGTTGARIHGREAVKQYWQAQWKEIDPVVKPLEIDFAPGGTAHVRVDQLIRDRAGKILQNREIEHVYEFDGPFITRMTIVEAEERPDDENEE